MNRRSYKAFTLFCCLLGSFVMFEVAPLTSRAFAQREDDGDRPREGRGGWRRFRREGGGNQEASDRPRRWGRNRDDTDNNEDRDRNDGDRDRENRDDDERGSFDVAEFAKARVKEFDKNGNQVIDGDELRGLRGPMASADLNDDKVISVEELTERFAERGAARRSREQPRAKSSSSDDGTAKASASPPGKPTRVYTGAAGGATSKDSKDSSAARRSYRFTPAGERLTPGLPSWFQSRDRNRDGQVAMSEYSRVWSQRMVNEFRRYDSNDDGVITPKEAAE